MTPRKAFGTSGVIIALCSAAGEFLLYAGFVGGMGAKDKNFHKDAMVDRGYADAANRVQELFMAGRREEAAAAVPDEYIDDENLIGPPERIRQRYQLWQHSGATTLCFLTPTDEVVELMAKIGRK